MKLTVEIISNLRVLYRVRICGAVAINNADCTRLTVRIFRDDLEVHENNTITDLMVANNVFSETLVDNKPQASVHTMFLIEQKQLMVVRECCLQVFAGFRLLQCYNVNIVPSAVLRSMKLFVCLA